MPVSPAAPVRRSSYHHGDLHRTLLAAAADLMEEQQGWEFSLRELARRAGVSHNAPYNHFADKRDLLAALAADGFAQLSACTAQAAEAAAGPEAALVAIGLAYVRFGLANPVRYRLMFGSGFKALLDAMPKPVGTAAISAKTVLRDAVRQAAAAGLLSLSPADQLAIDIAVLTAWSVVHGLTMLFLDDLTGEESAGHPAEAVAEAVLRRHAQGLLRNV